MTTTWKIGLQVPNFLPLFSWEIYFSICCLLILFTRWAVVRSQVDEDRRRPGCCGCREQRGPWCRDPAGAGGAAAPAHSGRCTCRPSGPKMPATLLHMSWEAHPSVETRGSYGFGFFPQFSVGLVWLVPRPAHVGPLPEPRCRSRRAPTSPPWQVLRWLRGRRDEAWATRRCTCAAGVFK